MTFQSEPGIIRWRLHLRSPPAHVYDALATDKGRATFWAESTDETDGVVVFAFPGHSPVSSRVLKRQPPTLFEIEYFGSIVTFTLAEDASGGTDLLLVAKGVPEAEYWEVVTGWVSVLLAMKAAVDHGIDLRNHDPTRSWNAGYADN